MVFIIFRNTILSFDKKTFLFFIIYLIQFVGENIQQRLLIYVTQISLFLNTHKCVNVTMGYFIHNYAFHRWFSGISTTWFGLEKIAWTTKLKTKA